MQIEENSVISFHFVLKDDKGEILDSTKGLEPEMALIGSGELVSGLEDSLIGKGAGDKISITLESDLAYGDYQKDLEIDMKIEDFPDTPEVGEEYLLDADDMAIPFAVEKIEGKKVFLNGNHLFAGKKVQFDVEILDVRHATREELDHGHVHQNGHHH